MIMIETIGGGAPLPFLADGSLDWESIEYLPTRQSIQNAWNGLSPEQQQALIDQAIVEANTPPPPPIPVPDWQGFLDSCDVTELGGNGVFQALVGINYAIAMDAYQLILRLKDGQRSPLEVRTLNFLYAMLTPGLSPELTESLQQSLTEFNIPIVI